MCTVLRFLNFDNFRSPDAGRCRERFSEIAGEGRHGIKGCAARLMQPFHDLAGAKLFLAGGSDECFHFLQGEIQQIR